MATEPRHAHDPDPATTGHVEQAEPAAADISQQTSQTTQAQAPAALPQHRLRRTRISGLWATIGCFAVILLLLLIFILQNSHTVEVSYLGFHGHLSLGVALLLAAVCGVLLVGLAGTARILQLRAAARRHRRADQKAGTPPLPRAPVS
jgi:uncharacterized integral membrane protein